MSVLRTLLLAAIRGYKRHLSARKGYGCAYRLHTGRCSCSTLGYRAVSRYGAVRGLGVLNLRLAECRLEALRQRARRPQPRLAQAGFVDCDVPCDASCADMSVCSDGACGALDVLSCGDDCDCGWPWSRDPPRKRPRRGGSPDPSTWEPGPGAPPLE